MNRWIRRIRGGRLAVAAALIWAVLPQATPAQAASDPCGSGSNAIVCENSKPGSPMSDWYAPNAYGDIGGFSTKESVQAGDTVQFKVQSKTAYNVQIYRLGWYGGDGARQISTAAQAAVTYPANYTNKPASCTTKSSTGLVDCGNWPVTASWTVPSDAVSGLYIANLTQTNGDGLMPYPFVVRKDSSTSDVVVQTSDQTWQAYNDYGGQDLYGGTGPAPDGRAYEVSYNRPLDIGGDNGIYGSEYEMLSWLERNGYDVSYLSGVDVSSASGATLLEKHKMYVSSGHDEYWTQSQYSNVLAARQAGVRQGFFSGNEVFWKTRLAPSIDGTNTADRTLACYKMTKMAYNNGIADPSGVWTGTWMDPTSTNYGQAYQPPNILTGSMFQANGYRNDAITVPGSYGKNRIWRNTSVAGLTAGQTATFPTGTLGYEWDSDLDNSTRPAGAIDVSSTTVDITDGTYRLDWGNLYGNGTATHNLVEFRDQTSGALVFGTGTVQWSWGLTNVPTYDPADTVVTADSRMQQATVNILADMGAQPKSLQSNLVTAVASTDTTGPAVTVTSPASGATVPALKPVTIAGTATDSGGGVVARVEVSTDGGATWKAAKGLTSWSYSWTPTSPGSASIKVRAVDDSVNLGAVTTVPITIGPQACPCTIWPASAVPGTVNAGDGGSLELGVKFRTTVAGSITGVRFYKSTANTGTHLGSLWTASGTRLATGTFSGETASGWQQLNFSTPVTVKANTTYVASYFAPNGGYSYDTTFAGSDAGLAPLTGLKTGTDGGNGVYHYGSTSAFPSSASSGSNYWVDVVLDTSTASTTPPTVSSTSPTSGATGTSITAPVSATFSSAVDTDSVTFTVKDPDGNTVPGAVTFPASNKATFTPSTELELNTRYTASVQASDVWGNTMAAPVTWSFTTSSTPPAVTCPCTLWSSSAVPANTDMTADPNSLELGTRFTSSAAGWVTGVTFYKGTGNTGVHTGSLWTDDGTLLASGTFTGETTSGWQTLTFATPVAITADTAYVVSYHAPNGNYAVDGGYFAAAHKSYPLTATADTTTHHNGLYKYGSDSAFPNGSYGSSNYWVGPVFTADNPSGQLAKATSSEVTSPLLAHTADAGSPLVTSLPAALKASSVKAAVTVLDGSKAAKKLHVTAVTSYNRATHKVTVHLSAPLPDGTRFKVTLTAKDKHHHTVKSHSWTLTSKTTVRKKN
ncbi:DUF4082 domain-containing protein [Streptomyces cellulosae]|uniref:DUF4082 domain-containing protein n=1 Tax=Streptomyces cellulosae TaxID=1968 RepID=UPI0004C7FDC2|nr:DUF4082 domain-containing protein [Streptomyces cellulosae]